MPQLFTNNARALLASGITDSATSLTVEASKADLFPTANTGTGSVPATTDWFKVTLQDSAGNVEIVYVRTRTAGSAIMSDLLRGQEGTTARAFSVGTVVGLRITALDIETSIGLGFNAVQLGGFFKSDPLSCAFTKTGAATVSIKAGTRIGVGGRWHLFNEATAVTMPTLTAGEDYAIWCTPAGALQANADPFNSPATPPVDGARKIGGFHYGLVAPGTTPAGGGFATTGFTNQGGSMIWTQADVDRIAGINEFSLWDLAWRCKGQQRGMVLDPQVEAWQAIYFCSTNHIVNGISRNNTDVASGSVLPRIPLVYGGDGTTIYGRFSQYEAEEVAASFGLRPPNVDEFRSAMFGVTEAQSLGGAASTIPVTLRQPGFTSRLGIEQATGHQWIFARGSSAAGGSGWITGPNRGDAFGNPWMVLLGGTRGDAAFSGSRASLSSSVAWNSSWHVALRAAGDHIKHI